MLRFAFKGLVAVVFGAAVLVGPQRAEAIAFGDVTTERPLVARIASGGGPDFTSYATGTFISQSWMLTAAHVIGGLPADAFIQSAFGDFSIAETRIHPLFDPLDLTLGYDIALIRVASPLPGGLVYPTLALDDPGDLIDVETVFLGYGLTEGGDDTGDKRQATAAIQFDFPEAFGFYSDLFGGAPYVRPGDSGGPAFATLAGLESIIGVASYSIFFGDFAASGFSPLAPARAFIEAALKEEIAAVPEPAGLALAGFAALFVLRNRALRHRA